MPSIKFNLKFYVLSLAKHKPAFSSGRSPVLLLKKATHLSLTRFKLVFFTYVL